MAEGSGGSLYRFASSAWEAGTLELYPASRPAEETHGDLRHQSLLHPAPAPELLRAGRRPGPPSGRGSNGGARGFRGTIKRMRERSRMAERERTTLAPAEESQAGGEGSAQGRWPRAASSGGSARAPPELGPGPPGRWDGGDRKRQGAAPKQPLVLLHRRKSYSRRQRFADPRHAKGPVRHQVQPGSFGKRQLGGCFPTFRSCGAAWGVGDTPAGP